MAKGVGLRPQHRRFADAYLKNGGNIYQAAIAAGYSETYAKSQSYLLLERDDIAAHITQRRRQMARRAVSPERVLLELASIGFADAGDYVTIEDGRVQIRDTDQIDPAARRAIVGIKEGANGVEVKLGDKVKALELMGRNLGMFREKVDLTTRQDTGKLDQVLEQLQEGSGLDGESGAVE